MGNEHILRHYRKDEYSFVERVIEWAEHVSKTHTPIKTDFIDPRQIQIIKNIVNSYLDLTMFFDGGYQDAERVRVLIAPDYMTYNSEDMGIIFFEAIGQNKFDKLQHKDYMGALLNIGIKRDKFGDIIISENKKQYIIAEELADYVRLQLTQIGQTKVKLEEFKREEINIPNQQIKTVTLTLSTLRVDTVISQLYNQSRSKILEMIKRNYLKVNWQTINQAGFKLEVGDVISLRDFGRSKFLEMEGSTKKGRIIVRVGKLI